MESWVFAVAIAPHPEFPRGKGHGAWNLRGSRPDQAAADGIAHQPGGLVNVELLQNPVAVCLCCVHADIENRRDLLRTVAFGNQLQYLSLARSQRIAKQLLIILISLDDRLRDFRA